MCKVYLKDLIEFDKESFLDYCNRCECLDLEICSDAIFNIDNDVITLDLTWVREKECIVPKFVYRIVNEHRYSNLFIRYLDLNNVKIIDDYGLYKFTIYELVANNLVKINSFGMKECSYLKELYLPNLESIESFGFSDCKLLEKIKAPNLKEIDSLAFFNCINLMSYK